jgi:hypothetical protein
VGGELKEIKNKKFDYSRRRRKKNSTTQEEEEEEELN